MDTGYIQIEIDGINQEDTLRIKYILHALVSSGGLLRMRGGKTTIHFDASGEFQGIQLDYRPWWRRKEN